jgi:hypothetical protein
MGRLKMGAAVLVPVLILFELVFSGAANADTLFGNVNMCGDTSSAGVICWNNWDATVGGGKVVRMYPYGSPGEPNNDWNVWDEGTVSAQKNWPFSEPAAYALNAQYNGKKVYKFAWAPARKGSGWCIDQRSFDNNALSGPAILEPCQPTSKFPVYQYFVKTSGLALIAVFATETQYNEGNAMQVALTAAPLGSGRNLLLEGLGNGYQTWYTVTPP